MILSLVPKGEVIADIGTDHGFVPFELIKRNTANKVIATDVSAPSLQKSKQLLETYVEKERWECRLGNGLEVLQPGEVDSVIIAGMGGVLIGEILEQGGEITKSIPTFILQPVQGLLPLREYLWNHEYTILQEEVVLEEGKAYVGLQVTHGKSKRAHSFFSPTLMENKRDEVDLYLQRQHQIWTTQRKRVEKMKDPHKKKEKMEELEKLLKECERWLSWREQRKY